MPAEMQADWVSVAEARDTILSRVPSLEAGPKPLAESLGQVLAEEVTAPLDLPLWDNSAMDGYAVRADDVRGASEAAPLRLRVIDDVAAGGFPARPVEPGTATRIMTGAPVPDGADTVIRVEHTATVAGEGAEEWVEIRSDFDVGSNVRRRGEDLRMGDRVLDRGTVLGAAEIGVAASVGRSTLQLVRRPLVGILASGDELVDVDGFEAVLAGRRIVSSNSYTLAAQLAESGLLSRPLGIAADSPESLRAHLLRARGCDALVTTAGISVGAHDYTRDVLLSMGLETSFWRVRMRPGSPFAFGTIEELGGIPWFGLPGNPVSCMVTFELFVRPALLRMAGHRRIHPPTVQATLLDDHRQRPGLTHFTRVRLSRDVSGATTARLTGSQGSGILTSMASADGLMVIPEGEPGAAAGALLPTIVLGGAPLREEPGY